MSMVLAVNEIFDSSSAVLIFRYCRCFLLAECFMNVNFNFFAKTVCLFFVETSTDRLVWVAFLPLLWLFRWVLSAHATLMQLQAKLDSLYRAFTR